MALFHLIARLGNLGVVHFLGANRPYAWVLQFPSFLGVVHFLGANRPYAWVLQFPSFLGIIRFLRSSTPLIITQQSQDKLWAARFRGCSHPPNASTSAQSTARWWGLSAYCLRPTAPPSTRFQPSSGLRQRKAGRVYRVASYARER